MREYPVFPPSVSNQISEEYYNGLIGQVSDGTCSKQVRKVEHRNGSHRYYTYHLTSVR